MKPKPLHPSQWSVFHWLYSNVRRRNRYCPNPKRQCHNVVRTNGGSTDSGQMGHIDLAICAEQLVGDSHTDKCPVDRPTHNCDVEAGGRE